MTHKVVSQKVVAFLLEIGSDGNGQPDPQASEIRKCLAGLEIRNYTYTSKLTQLLAVFRD